MPFRFAKDVWDAGVNPLGIVAGNQDDVRKLADFYGAQENRERLNQMPLDSQLFMRYLSGTGAEGMSIDQERGKAIRQAILDQEKNLRGPDRERQLQIIKDNYGRGHYQRVMRGDVPVYFGGSSEGVNNPVTVPSDKPFRDELKNSLGSFWAVPNNDGSYDIDERYNFNYAPGSKEGWSDPEEAKRREMLRRQLSTSLNPADIGRRIVMQGEGQPYSYRLRVNPDGTVLMNP